MTGTFLNLKYKFYISFIAEKFSWKGGQIKILHLYHNLQMLVEHVPNKITFSVFDASIRKPRKVPASQWHHRIDQDG
jgi:hypothetical protein